MQKRIIMMASLLVVMSVTSGCTWFSPKPTREPMAMLQAGVTNFAAKTSSEYKLKLDATLLGKGSDGKAQNLTLDLSANGDASSDPAMLALNTKVKGTMSVNQEKYALDTEVRANKQSAYALLNSLTGPAAEIPKEYVGQALGKWWKIPLPEALMKPYLSSLLPSEPVAATPASTAVAAVTGASVIVPVVPAAPVVATDSDSGTIQRLRNAENLFKNVSGYVKNVVYDGSNSIGGLNSYRYTAELDNAKLREFMIQYYKDNGAEPAAADLAKLDDFLAHFTSHLTFWVSVEGEILNRVSLNLKMDKVLSDDGKSSGRGDVSIDMSYMNFGKVVTAVEPAGASDFDLFGMLGGGADSFGADSGVTSGDGINPEIIGEDGSVKSLGVTPKTPVVVPPVTKPTVKPATKVVPTVKK